MKRAVIAALWGALVAALAVGALVWADASWKECRRVHPGWYCAAGAR